MQDLKKESGLSIYLKDDFRLDLDIKLVGGEFSSRTIRDMKPTLMDKIKINDNPLYYMYRDVHERVDDEKIKSNRLRYDLTVVLPGMIGSEFNKTFGHYHPSSYPEVYEIISGQALYLLQKPGKNDDEIDEAYLVEAKAGEKVIMPPHFGHITINPFSEPLVMSNWVADDFSSEYELYKKNKGGGFYVTKCQVPNPPGAEVGISHRAAHREKSQKNSKFQIVKNEHYKRLPKLIRAKPKELRQFGLEFDKPMYLSGGKNINKLKFLTHPENFIKELEPRNVLEF